MTRLLTLAGALLLLSAAPAQAETFDVTKTADTDDKVCSPSDCSLREAVAESNANAPGESDTINVPAGTYNLANGELLVTGQTIDFGGAGANSTVIRQTGPTRVIRIANSNAPVDIRGVTITGGNVSGNGGGILKEATSGALTVEDSALHGNRATSSGANGGGGGIHNSGGAGLTVEDSTVSHNSAAVSGTNTGGGGIWSSSGATLRNSTFSGNSSSSGGGAYFTLSGGGLIAHATVAGNSAGLPGGGLLNAGSVTPVQLQNTIIAHNSAGGAGGGNCSGLFDSNGNNLETANTCMLVDPEDQRNTDPGLGPLADNGGPTQTMALPPGSPAIDAADPIHCGPVPQDQRGANRTSNGCDIGAFEFEGLTVASIPDCSPTGQIPLSMVAAPGEGVDDFLYRIDGGPMQIVDAGGGSQANTNIAIPEGRRQIEYWGKFSNDEELGHHRPPVLVDKTRPSVDVRTEQRSQIYVIRRRATVRVQAADALSGLVSDPSGAGQRVSTATRGRKSVERTVTDLCGHQASDAVDYRVLGPGLGIRAVIEVTGGTVRFRRRAGGGSAGAAQKGQSFTALREPREVPIGTFVDTRRGRARITTSSNRQAGIQDGQFSAGLFQVFQSRRRRARGLTELSLKGSSFRRCGTAGRGKASAAQSRLVRRLRSNARGRFRTRGRHSAATVRGTVWVTADRCDGTLTRVTRGRVAVRDFRRKRTIVLRAGKSYLARPR